MYLILKAEICNVAERPLKGYAMSNNHCNQAPGHNKTYTIIVNGRKREVTDHELNYWEVIRLAFPDAQPAPNIVYTVTYSGPGKDGSLVEGQSVKIHDRMIFCVRK